MTIEEVLAVVDEIKPNTYDDTTKILWLSELDGTIYNDILKTHEGTEDYLKSIYDDEDTEEVETITEFNGYTSSDLGTTLLAPFPYDKLYREYIFAQIDYSNGETDRYINSATKFNAAYKEFSDYWNRTHLPVSNPLKIF